MKSSNIFQKVLLYLYLIALLIPIKSGYTQDKKFGVVNPDIGEGRKRVSNTSEYPWSTICKLRVAFKNGVVSEGTGTLIGPRHVLTAAHVVYNREHGGEAISCLIVPGYDDSNMPFGNTYSSITKHPNYDSFPSNFDIAVIKTNKEFGEEAGWLGLMAASDVQLQTTAYVAGYPAWPPPPENDYDKIYPKYFDGEKMYRNSGEFSKIDPYYLIFPFAISGGMSGSGIYQKHGDSRYIIGVVSGEDADIFHNRIYYGQSNYATRITNDLYDWIRLHSNDVEISNGGNSRREFLLSFDGSNWYTFTLGPHEKKIFSDAWYFKMYKSTGEIYKFKFSYHDDLDINSLPTRWVPRVSSENPDMRFSLPSSPDE